MILGMYIGNCLGMGMFGNDNDDELFMVLFVCFLWDWVVVVISGYMLNMFYR